MDKIAELFSPTSRALTKLASIGQQLFRIMPDAHNAAAYRSQIDQLKRGVYPPSERAAVAAFNRKSLKNNLRAVPQGEGRGYSVTELRDKYTIRPNHAAGREYRAYAAQIKNMAPSERAAFKDYYAKRLMRGLDAFPKSQRPTSTAIPKILQDY